MRKGKSTVIKKEKDASSALGEETFKRMIVWIDVKIDTCHRMKKIQVFLLTKLTPVNYLLFPHRPYSDAIPTIFFIF